MRVLTPGLLNGFCLRSALSPATRSASLSRLIEVTSICGVSRASGYEATAPLIWLVIVSDSGHPSTVSSTCTVTSYACMASSFPPFAVSVSSQGTASMAAIMPRSVTDRPSSGSMTRLSRS